MGRYSDIILLSDMDGTLLNSQGIISEENKKAIQKLVEGGGKFGIATGRNLSNAQRFLKDIPLNGYCIFANGSLLYDYTKEQYIKECNLKKDNLVHFLKKCLKEKEQITIQIYTRDMCHIVSKNEYVKERERKNHAPITFTSLENMLHKEWIKILFSGSKEDMKWLEEHSEYLEQEKEVHRVHSSDIYYEFLPFDANKGTMVSYLKQELKDGMKLYAVGDYYNDIEMLQSADVGIAMGNAPEDVKKYADMVCPNCDQDGIAYIISHM